MRTFRNCRSLSPHSFLTFALCLLLVGILTMLMPHAVQRLLTSRSVSSPGSVWLVRSSDGYVGWPVAAENLEALYPSVENFDPATSPFMLPKGAPVPDIRGSSDQSAAAGSKVYTIGFYDPEEELEFLARTTFKECLYDNCKMVARPEMADAVLFYVVKLKNSPTPKFKRRSGQRWVLMTNEAPSRFSNFISLNRTGIRGQINWTMTHKLDSDIPIPYGMLQEKESIPEKDFEQIYSSKTHTAAWFVSHCPVRSDRKLYVQRMETRIDIDSFGFCGKFKCGQGQKIPGVYGMRIEADRETCFPLLSAKYKYYLAFENSLCNEYVTEKFFKLFKEADVVPVVRGGADYQSYFPPGTYVDAADFKSPEDLADFLDDLGNDKERYIHYLRNKNRYRPIMDEPPWQCKLCQKLNQDHAHKHYKNVHQWFVRDSCANPKDFL